MRHAGANATHAGADAAGRHDRVDPKLDARRLPLHGLPAVAAAPRPCPRDLRRDPRHEGRLLLPGRGRSWSGVFVHAPYDALTLALQPGDEVSVRDAYVDEELGAARSWRWPPRTTSKS